MRKLLILSFLLACSTQSTSAAIALVNHVDAAAASGSSVTTAAVSMTGANFLAAVITCFYDGSNTCTASDSSSNTWLYGPIIQNGGDNIQIRIAYVCAPTVTGSQTFTTTASGGRTNVAMYALGYSGAQGTASCNDGAGTSVFIGGTSCNNTDITPAGSGEVFITGVMAANAAVTAFSLTDSFVIEDSNLTVVYRGAAADFVNTGVGALGPTWTATGNGGMGVACVLQPFKPGAGAAPVPQRTLMGVGL